MLYCYEFPADNFQLLDEFAVYYISYQPAEPVTITEIPDAIAGLLKRNIELRFTQSLRKLADAVIKSNLNFSLIRMRNAK